MFYKYNFLNLLIYTNLIFTYSFKSIYTPYKYISKKTIKKIYFEKIDINNIYLDDNINYLPKNNLSLEHICPQSYLKDITNAKKDMHNIFLTHNYINLHRSNYKFVNQIDNEMEEYLTQINNNNLLIIKKSEIDINLNYKNDILRYFIPKNTSRGMISRTICYMKLIYPKIDLKNIIDTEILIKWNIEYPPSQFEIERNKLIYNIQGNINPYTEGILDIYNI